MIPQTGIYAYYTFSSRFKSLNGIYTVVKLQSYVNALNDGVDFGNALYVPAGMAKEDYTKEYSIYMGMDVYFLQATDGTTVYPVPASVIVTEPDLEVGKFNNLYMTIYLGLWDDPKKLSWLTAMINDIVSQSTGSTTNAVLRTSSPDTIWLKNSEYKQVDKTRSDNAKALMPLSMQIQQLKGQVDSLKSENQYLRDLIIQAGLTNKT